MTADNLNNPAPCSSPAASSTDQGEDPTTELLDDLQPGGLVDTVLDRAKPAEWSTDEVEIHGHFWATTNNLRAAADEARNHYRLSADPCKETKFVAEYIVDAASKKYHSDPVLLYSLACHWGAADREGGLRSGAWKNYLNHPEVYDQLLGDFIPAAFREEAWSSISQKRFESGTNATALDDWPVYSRRLEKRREKELLGVATGLPKLDSCLHGLRGLTYLGSGPGVGKTCLALFMAVNALRRDPHLGVLFYTLDMPKTVVLDRLVCQVAGVDYADLVGDTDDEQMQQRLQAAEAKLHSEILPRLRVAQQFDLKKNTTLDQCIVEEVNRLLDSASCWPLLIVIDYFQLLPISAKGASGIDADFERVRSLQRFREKSRSDNAPDGFPILVITEVRKGDSGRTEIGIGDLMGSARLGYSADNVLVLEAMNPSSSEKAVPVRLHILKSRDGTVRGNIDLVFEHTKSRSREATARPARKTRGKPQGATGTTAAQTAVDPFAGLEEA